MAAGSALSLCRQKPNVLFVRSAFSAWHTTGRVLAIVAD